MPKNVKHKSGKLKSSKDSNDRDVIYDFKISSSIIKITKQAKKNHLLNGQQTKKTKKVQKNKRGWTESSLN